MKPVCRTDFRQTLVNDSALPAMRTAVVVLFLCLFTFFVSAKDEPASSRPPSALDSLLAMDEHTAVR